MGMGVGPQIRARTVYRLLLLHIPNISCTYTPSFVLSAVVPSFVFAPYSSHPLEPHRPNPHTRDINTGHGPLCLIHLNQVGFAIKIIFGILHPGVFLS